MPEHPPLTAAPVPFAKLPDRPDLDQLKTQAKEVLRRHRDGEAEAVATVDRHFNAPDGEPLTLAQAQLVLARTYGYDSWPKLKAYVEGVTRERLVTAIRTGDRAAVRDLLRRRPELANATTGDGEQRMTHLAVLNNDPSMLRLLMDHGADARIGIWPHRDSNTAAQLAADRGLDQLTAVIEDVEAERRASMSCPNVTISPQLDRLGEAIRAGRTDDAIAMLDASPDLIRQCDRDGATPLHTACAVADERLVAWLCDHRADARKRDISDLLPIDRAVFAADWRHPERVEPALRIVRGLIAHGSPTTEMAAAALGDERRLREIDRESPLRPAEGQRWHWLRGGLLSTAVIFDRRVSVECLLDLGLDPNEPIPVSPTSDDEDAISWGGPVWRAAAMGRIELARLLLDRGADPNGNVYASGWPLDRAYERNDRPMIDLLYQRGATPTTWTVCAAYDNDMVRRMLEERDVTPREARELTWSAACCKNLPALRMALPRVEQAVADGVADDIDWHDMYCQPMRGYEPTDAVRPDWYRDEDRFTILGMLLEVGPPADVTGRYGLTLLHFVAARDAPHNGPVMPDDERNRFAAMLLDAGADPAARDDLLASTALGWACHYGRPALVALLLDRGVPANEPDTPAWATPLARATKAGHEGIVALLRARGATA
ncbi:MAG: hypothetical protein AAGK09_08005 [Planctomycetota bacterium]